MHFPAPLASAVAATIVEFICALFLMVGLFTRISAGLLVAVLGVAILQNLLSHRDPQLAILYTLIVLTMALMGGERFSLDTRLQRPGTQTNTNLV
jgi:putative oxidoreductase